MRCYQEYGLALFSWFSYIGIAFSGWAIATQYYSRKVAIISVLIILSMPQIIYASTTPKNDLILGFIASVVLLLSSKLLNDLDIKKFLLVWIALSLVLVQRQPLLRLYYFIFLLFYFSLQKIIHLNLFSEYFGLIAYASGLTLIPCLLLSQSYLFVWNHLHWGGFSGPSACSLIQ